MAKRVTIDTLFKGRSVSAPDWSPDGRWVAFVVGETDYEKNTGRSAIWLMSADGKEKRQLTRGLKVDGTPAGDSSPRWSPDGKRIAFFSNRSGSTQIWLIHPFGGEAEPLTGEDTKCGAVTTDAFFAGLEWSPDSARIAFVAQLPEPKDKPKSDVKVVGVNYGEGYADLKSRLHVWTVAAEGGKAKRLTRGNYHSGDPRWSPDGRWIAFVSNRSRDEEAVASSVNKNYDLWLVPSDGGAVKRLTTNEGPDISPRWSPDGRHIAYLSCPRCGSHRDVLDMWVLDAGSLKTRNLTEEFGYLVDRLTSRCWSPDGKALWFAAAIGAQHHLFRVKAAGGAVERVTRGRRLITSPLLSPDGNRLVCMAQFPDKPAEIQVRTVSGFRLKAAARFNDWLKEYRLGTIDVIRWQSDEFTIEGVLVKPPNYRKGRRYPTIVAPHGGPHGHVTPSLNLAWQLLAAQGYVVLAPNFRGSDGYGQAFIDADRGDLGGGDFRDVMRGVDKLIADGIADPKRLGIFGGSYGGYMTMWSVGNTDRYKAAVAVCGVANNRSMFGTTDIKSWCRWECRGYPWENFEEYARSSPITYVANVKTPTLIMHGEKDLRVPVSQSEEFYSALKARGVKTQFVRYPDEGHGISKPHHVKDHWTRVLAWFAKHLR